MLEMIKAKRRVAWMVLQNATVVSLDENVLMLRFPRQGDVKGFTSAKYDEVVKQALNARYGVNLVVRAISGPGTGPSGGGSRRPAPPSPPAPASPAPAPPAPAPAPARRAHPQSDAPWPDEPPPEDQPEPTSGGEPLASERPASRVPAPSPARPEREQRDDTDFDPNAEDSSAGVAAELTGVGLIQRELGGEIIGEFED